MKRKRADKQINEIERTGTITISCFVTKWWRIVGIIMVIVKSSWNIDVFIEAGTARPILTILSPVRNEIRLLAYESELAWCSHYGILRSVGQP